ncbi:hypothetical protein [Sulfurisphaera ohwakuensis]|uniref:Uncharacterized protein n=1 Tax=Sulfurisphaera ohwakuensis TaxID=69656 RepID=A0A650CGZ3_SULOH|nr:hypothetical protein [Sulfurisphaera ohwakuensis]MBB5254209.1 hypothetical protein [Sulfurisphaera ohwakuensis]QGR16807.1 hypothetical protein D1869_06110 [Sulfurisphaera ohwakuensis]
MNKLEEFACIDFDLVCTKNVPKADSICFHIKDCNCVMMYIVEKKSEKFDPTSDKFDDAISQIDSTLTYLSSICNKIRCKKLLVVEYLTATKARLDKKSLPYIIEYKKIKNKKGLNIEEKIAKFVYENKKI